MDLSIRTAIWCLGVCCVLAVLTARKACAATDAHDLYGTTQSQVTYLKAASDSSDATDYWQDGKVLNPIPAEHFGDAETTESTPSEDSTTSQPPDAELSTESTAIYDTEVSTDNPVSSPPTSKLPIKDGPRLIELFPRYSEKLLARYPSLREVSGRKPEYFLGQSDSTCSGEDCAVDEPFPEGAGVDAPSFEIFDSFEDFVMSSMKRTSEAPRIVIGVFSSYLTPQDIEIEQLPTLTDEQLTNGQIVGDVQESNNQLAYSKKENSGYESLASVLSRPLGELERELLIEKIAKALNLPETSPEPEEEQSLLIDPSTDEVSEDVSSTESADHINSRPSSRKKRSHDGDVRVLKSSHDGDVRRSTNRVSRHLVSRPYPLNEGYYYRQPAVVYRTARPIVFDHHHHPPRFNVLVHPRRAPRRRIIKKIVVPHH